MAYNTVIPRIFNGKNADNIKYSADSHPFVKVQTG